MRSDVTFGTQSVVANAILQSVLFGKSLYFKPLGASPAPLYAGDLASIVEKVMSGKECQGKSYFAAGPKHYDWNSYVKVLEKSTGTSNQAKLNANAWENVRWGVR